MRRNRSRLSGSRFSLGSGGSGRLGGCVGRLPNGLHDFVSAVGSNGDTARQQVRAVTISPCVSLDAVSPG